MPGSFLYIENPTLGVGGSEALIAVEQDKKLLSMYNNQAVWQLRGDIERRTKNGRELIR